MNFREWLISEADVNYWSSYAKSWNFRTESEAREWLRRKITNNNNEFGAIFGKQTPEQIEVEVMSIPLYKSGNSWKIGKRIRKKSLTWDDIEIRPNLLQNLTTVGYVNWADGPTLSRPQMVRVAIINPVETVDDNYVQSLANQIKSNEGYFKPVVVDNHYSVIDGHHRLEAAKLLRFKMIPIQMITYANS